MHPHSIIAIDGPAASGKSTTARAVARALGFLFVSSGAYYRALAWMFHRHRCEMQRETDEARRTQNFDAGLYASYRPSQNSSPTQHSLSFPQIAADGYETSKPTWSTLQHAVDIFDDSAVTNWLASLHLENTINNGEIHPLLNGIDSTEHHSDPAVAAVVSPLAALPAVRTFLLTALRGLAKHHDLVMEGRDIGSVVFPNATFKFYLDASPEERARRRRQEGVLDAIAERDKQDTTRAIAPLLVAEGAIVIDTTNLNVEETVQKVLSYVKTQT